MKIIKVATTIPTNKSYSYSITNDFQIGDFVVVKIRNKPTLGIIWSVDNETKHQNFKCIEQHFPEYNYEKKLEFISWFAKYNLIPIGTVIKTITPNLKALLTKSRDKSSPINEQYSTNLKELSIEQKQSLDQISLAKYSPTILQGVTGSGKTEVYFHAADQVLQSGKQVLIILPEIALTNNMLHRFENSFLTTIATWHSKTSINKKTMFWKKIVKNEIQLIVGTRSSLLIPFPNLGLIIIDEEHDSSYKQEDRQCYHARDMAVMKAYLEDIPIILCSATPSLETMNNFFQKKYQRVILPKRFGNAQLPKINIIDMKQQELEPKTWISPTLKQAILNNFKNNEQTLIFLNRRGYAPLTLCKTCGYREMCINCSTSLVQHIKNEITTLTCHQCNFSKDLPDFCSRCNNIDTLVACGPGIQRIEEEIKSFIPQANIATLSSDNQDDQNLEEIIDNINNQKTNIIVATQILSKGYHFPNLTLVGIIDIDTAIQNVDLRASEQTYGLIQQVIGRAGRAAKPGQVFIQTYQPEQKLIKHIIAGDIDEFSQYELQSRKNAAMPPFSYCATISLLHQNLEELNKQCHKFAKNMPTRPHSLTVIGPMTPYIEKIRTYYQKKFLVKSTKKFEIQQYITSWLENIKHPKKLKLQIDMSPLSLV